MYNHNIIKQNIFFVFRIFIILVFLSSVSFAKDTITWLFTDYPPFAIVEGPNKKKGMLDLITNHVSERLVEYNHLELTANVKRITYFLEKEQEIMCICGMNKSPERDNKFYYSIPAIIAYGVSIVTRKDLLDTIKKTEIVSLENLLKNKNLKLGIPSERSFGKKIDIIIKKYKNSDNIFIQHIGNINKSLLGMLLHKRIDYMLARPYEAIYLSKNIYQEDNIAIVPFIESDEYIISYFACSKYKKSQQVLKKINKILEKDRPTNAYRNYMEKWLDKENIQKFRKLYDEVFLKLDN